MGLSNTTDLFETCIREILQGLNGCTNIADNVLVYGTIYDEFKSNVISFLDHCVEEDMHLNPDKIKIDCPEVPFFRNILSKDGTQSRYQEGGIDSTMANPDKPQGITIFPWNS